MVDARVSERELGQYILFSNDILTDADLAFEHDTAAPPVSSDDRWHGYGGWSGCDGSFGSRDGADVLTGTTAAPPQCSRDGTTKQSSRACPTSKKHAEKAVEKEHGEKESARRGAPEATTIYAARRRRRGDATLCMSEEPCIDTPQLRLSDEDFFSVLEKLKERTRADLLHCCVDAKYGPEDWKVPSIQKIPPPARSIILLILVHQLRVKVLLVRSAHYLAHLDESRGTIYFKFK